jgi:hypothetical protein
LRGAEAGIVKGLLTNAVIELPWGGDFSDYIYIYLDSETAPRIPQCFWTIYDLALATAKRLAWMGYNIEVFNAVKPLWTLEDDEYLKVYREDANPDGSITFVIPLKYPNHVATAYYWWLFIEGEAYKLYWYKR